MNILVLAWDIPATTKMPGSPRLFNLCRALARRHRLTLLTLRSTPERYQWFMSDPVAIGTYSRIINLPERPPPTWWRRQVHRFLQQAHFATRYRNPGYHVTICREVRNTYQEDSCDVIFADGLPSAQYVADAGVAYPAVVDLHDSLTLLYSRAARAERRWSGKLALLAELRSIRRCESSLSRRFSAIVTNSEVDELFLRSLDRSGNFVTIPNGVDVEYFATQEGKSNATRLVFTGVMDYAPNEDAAVYFADAILPLVRARYPGVEFWIVGKDPTERVQALARARGVHVTGEVPDVRPYLENAGVFVCPLRFGAGVKNKILAALAMGKAVVATPVSLEGLDLQGDEHLLVASEPSEFAAQVIKLIEDPEMAVRLGRQGCARVKAAHSWERSGAQLEAILHGVAHKRMAPLGSAA